MDTHHTGTSGHPVTPPLPLSALFQVLDKKTKSLLSVLSKLGLDSEKKTLLIVKSAYEHIMMAGRNIEKLEINTADKISIFDVLNADKIVIEKDALAHVQEFFGGDRKEAATA